MKTCLKILIAGLLCGLSAGAFNARATLEVSAGVEIHARADFDAPLASYGRWVEVGSYGRCWRPAGVAITWLPYCDGEWVWTECGWYWQSDEPWAWACYHYGRWVDDPFYGWVWVPDIEWAPAWVYWRIGGGYIGWAPCPPVGIEIAPSAFAFVKVGDFHERLRPSVVIVNNTTIIRQTKQIVSIERESRNIGGSRRKVVVNKGPGEEFIQKATGQKPQVVPIQEAARRTWLPPSMARKSKQPVGVVDRPQTHQPAPELSPNQQVPRREIPDPPNQAIPPDRRPPPSPGAVPEGVGPHGRGNHQPEAPPVKEPGKQHKEKSSEPDKHEDHDTGKP